MAVGRGHVARRTSVVCLVLAGSLAPGSATACPTVAEKGCLDITGGSADYTAATGRVRVLVELADRSCRAAVYALRVYDSSGTLSSTQARGTGETFIMWEVFVAPASDGSLVAVEMTTARHGTVADVAPDPAVLDANNDTNQNGLLDVAELLDGAVPTTGAFH